MSSSVTVNMGVNADATGTISVFTQEPDVPTTNVIVSQVTLPTSLLYNSEGDALIKFQGNGDTLVAELEDGFSTTESAMVSALQSVINSALNAENAVPFNAAKYNNATEYRLYSNFGALALGSYADYIFGHVAATAAIDNDTLFINRMNGLGELDAKLASKLVTEIRTLTNDECLSITQQVLGQDSSRASGVDNDSGDPPGWQSLQFKGGDSIYFSIRLTKPNITMLNMNNITQLPAAADFQNIQYHIKVFLADANPVSPPPATSSNWVVAEGGNGAISTSGARTTFTSYNGYETNFKTTNTSTSGQPFTFTYTVVDVAQFVIPLCKADGTPVIIFVSQPNGTTLWFPYNPMGPSMPAGPGGTYTVGDIIGFTYNSADGVRVLKNGAIDEGFNNIPITNDAYIYQLNLGVDNTETTVAFDNIAFNPT